MLPTPQITNANVHPEKLYASKILCLLLIIFQLMGEAAAPPRAEKTSMGPQAWRFGHLLVETALSLLFLFMARGPKGPKREGERQLLFIHTIGLKFP